MAIDFLKGAAQGIANKALRKVSGNLPGLLGFGKGRKGGNSSDTASLSQNKFTTKNFSFPLDVEAEPGLSGNQGHYIMFFINQQQNAKLQFGDPDKNTSGSVVDSIKSEMKVPNYIKKLQSDGSYTKVKNDGGFLTHAINAGPPNMRRYIQEPIKSRGSTITVNRAPTTRMDTAIALFMPAQVQVNYGATYTDFEIGAGAAIAGNAVTDVMNNMTLSGLQSAASKAAPQLMGEGVEYAKRAGLKGAGMLLPGATNLEKVFDMKRAQIKAPRMELAFEGISKRDFNYTFKMMPKNQAEADEIRNIIFAFKSNMLPEFVDGNRAGRRLTVPNTFDISYMYNGSENPYLHKISTCVLTSLQVSYGGDRYKTFDSQGDGAPPVDTSIQLAFKELELITRERVHEGY
tara:strand:- start:1366 stop:2571 length:1206 start_codon:yes stop_codon:yes gene_type:complete